jgi:hypothetical protein
MSFLDCITFEEYAGELGCGERTGGAKDLLLVKQGVTVDTTDEASVAAAIASGDAFLFPNLKIELGEPSPNETEGPIAAISSRTTTYDYEAPILDYKVNAQNVAAWNAILDTTGAIFGEAVIHADQSNSMFRLIGKITIQGGIILPPESTELQVISLTLKWRSKLMPELVDTVNPIFTA